MTTVKFFKSPTSIEAKNRFREKFAPQAGAARSLALRALDRVVSVRCVAPDGYDLLAHAYGGLRCEDGANAILEYLIDAPRKGVLRIARTGRVPLLAHDVGEFLFLFEKDLTIELQRLRRDLYFLHAAAVEFAGRASLVVGASGQGKSTTTWALLHHGFGYLSDELGPVCLKTMRVYPYCHALCLKRDPPFGYALPPGALRTSRTVHVPVPCLPGPAVPEPLPLTAIFFVAHSDREHASILEPISSGEGAARLFAHALNPLAHRQEGLSAAVAMARAAPSFKLLSSDLTTTCEQLSKTLSGLAAGGRCSGVRSHRGSLPPWLGR